MRLSRAKGATLADSVGIVTITDSSPRLSISSEAEYEGGFKTFTVTLSAAFDEPFTVNFATQDPIIGRYGWAAANAGQDYVATSGTLTFAPAS